MIDLATFDAPPGAYWFGWRWSAAVSLAAETPVGETCLHCDEPVLVDDCGTFTTFVDVDEDNDTVSSIRAMHAWCQLRSVLGSIGHLLQRCTCHLSADDANAFHDPPGLSVQNAAIEVWNYLRPETPLAWR